MKIKVCGMKDAQNIEALLALSPDFMGFIFYEKSARFVGESLDEALLKSFPKHIKKVGVFVNASVDYILKMVKKYNLDYAQLHGDEMPDFCKTLRSKGVGIIKAFGVDESFSFSKVYNYKAVCDFFLFDTKAQNHGGNGVAFDWQLLNKYDNEKPYFLAGGVDNQNISQLSSLKVMPYCLDINSKFEISPAFKDIEKIKELKLNFI